MIAAIVVASLLGMWQQPCLQKNQRSENFTATDIVYTETYFKDSVCKEPLLQFRITGDYSIDGSNMDFEFAETFIVVSSEDLIWKMNADQECGIADWQMGKEVNISGLWCDFFGYGQKFRAPLKGDKKFGIWKLENDILFLGQLTPDHDGSSPLQRPIVFNSRGFVKVQ